MIVFDLRCDSGSHVFEAWFASSAAFEDQRERGLLVCPLCGDQSIGKALMAPNIASKTNQITISSPNPAVVRPTRIDSDSPTRETVIKAVLAEIAGKQAEVLKSSTWVGKSFESKARAMDAGDEPATAIHGQATIAQARAMVEDGLPVMPLLVPIVPPEQCN